MPEKILGRPCGANLNPIFFTKENGIKYSRMNQVKVGKDTLKKVEKAVFYKFYLFLF